MLRCIFIRYNFIDFIQVTSWMRRSQRNGSDSKKQQKQLGLVEAQWKVIGLKNIIGGVVKRIQCQVICKLLARYSHQSTKFQKFKLLSFTAQRYLKEIKQRAFSKLKSTAAQQIIKSKSVIILTKILAKSIHNKLRLGLDGIDRKNTASFIEIDQKKYARESVKNGRQSEQSHLLSVSDVSLRSSRTLIKEQDQQYTKQSVLSIRRENEQLKRMVLSVEVRQSLMRMQRFDRYIYNIESEKVLKGPITDELRRLQKMKNEFKQMRTKFYDNELTVTCIFNHVKLVSQMNRELTDLNALKIKITDYEKQMADLKTQHRKQISQYKKKLMLYDLANSKDKRNLKESLVEEKTPSETSYKSASIEKSQRLAQVEKQNEELKKSITLLQDQMKDIEAQKSMMEEGLRKLQKSRLLLPPRKPSATQKDLSESLKKYQQNQTRLQGEIGQLNTEICKTNERQKQMSTILQQLKIENARLKSELDVVIYSRSDSRSIEKTPRALLSQNSESKSSLIDEQRQRMKQLEDFLLLYEAIRANKNQQVSYQRELNELRNAYPESTLVEILQHQLHLQFHHQTILTSVKSIINLFSQNGWKRRTSLLLKEEGEIFACINQIISMLLNLSKEKEQLTKSHNQLEATRKKCRILADQNNAVKQQIKQLTAQLSKMNELNNKLSLELQTHKSKPALEKSLQEVEKVEEVIFLGSASQQRQMIKSELDHAYLTIDYLHVEIEQLKNQLLQTKLTLANFNQNSQTKREEAKELKIERSNSSRSKDASSDKVSSLEEKFANYKILFEKVKSERDNLKLLLEEKNEEYQISKENQEKYEELKKKDQHQIALLKQKCNHCQIENQSLSTKLSEIVNDTTKIKNQHREFEIRMNEILLTKDQQNQRLMNDLKNLQNILHCRHMEFEEMRMRFEADYNHFYQENNYLRNTVEIMERENYAIKSNLQAKLSQEQVKCDKISSQLSETKQSLQRERQMFRERINEFTKISQSISINYMSESHQKQQLRKQLQSMNSELASSIRNFQSEKRQNRRYIQQLINQIQTKSVIHNEQKRLLREEVERARTEQYQINQDKIKKLRQDIHELRLENQRLISIIDSNQAPFNQLVQEHREMYEEILALQEGNRQLLASVASLQQQKAQLQRIFEASETEKICLVNQLHDLERKIIEFQTQVKAAIDNESTQDIIEVAHQQTINHLSADISYLKQQNAMLLAKNSELSQNIIEIQRHVMKLESEASNLKFQLSNSQANKNNQGSYSKYLEQKLQIKEVEIKQNMEKEVEMLNKIEGLMRLANEHQIQRQHFVTMINQKDHQLMNYANAEAHIAMLVQRIHQLQSIIYSKDAQISKLQEPSTENKLLTSLKEKIVQKELQLEKVYYENNKLKLALEASHQAIAKFQVNQSENQKMCLQNKRLSYKISVIEAQYRQIKQKYIQSDRRMSLLQTKLKQATYNQALSSNESIPIDFTISKIAKEDLSWSKQQLIMKETQVNQLRNLNLDLQSKLSEAEKQIAALIIKVQANQTYIKAYEQISNKLRNTENALYRLENQKKDEILIKTQRLEEKQQQIQYLRNNVSQLMEKNKNLNESLSNFKKSQKGLLKEIAKQLDNNYKCDDEEIYLTILQKISIQIGELIEVNNRLKERSESVSKEDCDLAIQEVENSLLRSFNFMLDEFLSFLVHNNIINPEHLPSLPKATHIQRFILDLGPLLKQLFVNSVKSSEEEIIKYNSIIRDMRMLIEQAYTSKNLENLSNLLRLLKQSD